MTRTNSFQNMWEVVDPATEYLVCQFAIVIMALN